MGRSYSQVQHDGERERDRLLQLAISPVTCPDCGHSFTLGADTDGLPDKTGEQRALRASDLEPTAARLAAALEAAVGDGLFGVWLAPLQLLDATPDTLFLAAPAETRAWVAARFSRVLDTVAAELAGRDMTVTVVEQRGSALARTLGDLHTPTPEGAS